MIGAECLSETLVLIYQKIRYHNPQKKSQIETYRPTTQGLNFNEDMNFPKMNRLVKASHSV
jgi:hypothetical protein